jgi:hypothetical protein
MTTLQFFINGFATLFIFPYIYHQQHATYENRKEKMIDGEYYLAGDPVLKKKRKAKTCYIG